jgi:hypothetical protein
LVFVEFVLEKWLTKVYYLVLENQAGNSALNIGEKAHDE